MRVRRLLAGLLTAALLAVPMPAHADGKYGLGGGTDWQPGSVFPLIAGVKNSVQTKMIVQNMGTVDAEVALNINAPAGVSVRSLLQQPVVIAPGKVLDYPLEISIGPSVVQGIYEVLVSVEQTNVPLPENGGTVYAPAVNGKFQISVNADSQQLQVDTINAADGSPAIGDLKLYYQSENEQPLLIDSTHGSTLKRRVVPGKYKFTFEIPGLIQKAKYFTVFNHHDAHVVMKVQGAQFDMVSVKANGDSRSVDSADLLAVLRNSLTDIQGPLTLSVDVKHDGVLVEKFTLATMTTLAVGTAEYPYKRYTPPNGFSPGEWTFSFMLSNDLFKLRAETVPKFTIEGTAYLWWIAGGALAIVGFVTAWGMGLLPKGVELIRWFFLLWKRRKKEEEEEEVAGGEALEDGETPHLPEELANIIASLKTEDPVGTPAPVFLPIPADDDDEDEEPIATSSQPEPKPEKGKKPKSDKPKKAEAKKSTTKKAKSDKDKKPKNKDSRNVYEWSPNKDNNE